MIPERTTMEVRRAGPAAVVEVRGEVTAASEESLMAAWRSCASASAVVLNFAGLEHMNSGGIGMMVTMLVRANRNRQRVLACNLSGHYREIFSLTRLDEAIGVFDDEPAALAAAGTRP